MPDTAVTMEAMNSHESLHLRRRMLAIAERISADPAVDDFAKTGWLPDKVFDLLFEFYDTYDQYIAHNLKSASKPVRCALHCTRCCKQPVRGLYALEIVSLYRHLRDRGDYEEVHNAFNQAAADFQSAVARNLPPGTSRTNSDDPAIGKAHKELAAAASPCPLLKDDKCSAYEARPVTCRAYHSVGDPTLCTTPKGLTFLLEPHDKIDAVFHDIGRRLNIQYPSMLAHGLVTFGFERDWRPWREPSRAQ